MADSSEYVSPVEINILVVDDDAQVRSVIVDYVRSFGFKNIIEAHGGEHALKIIRDHRVVLHLVLSDWDMPVIDGFTVLKAVRNDPAHARVKFIMITSQKNQERTKIALAKKWGVNAYIVKPFRGETLKEKIWTTLGWVHKKETKSA